MHGLPGSRPPFSPAALPARLAPQKTTLSLGTATSAASVASGTEVTFTLTVTNTGAATALGVTLADTLPAKEGVTVAWALATSAVGGSCNNADGKCNLGDLAAGASVSVTVTGTPTTAATATLTNAATVAATNLDTCTTCASSADIEVTA